MDCPKCNNKTIIAKGNYCAYCGEKRPLNVDSERKALDELIGAFLEGLKVYKKLR